MPNGETITENLESSIENLNIEHWEDVQMTNTLRLLNGEDQTSFYRIEGEKVVYDIETVKKYLTHICKKEDGTLKTWKEMTDDIRAENIQAEIGGGSTTTRTTAVQIALEYLGYDVGKIDGNQGGNTEKAIKKFQREHNLNIDGQPRPESIASILNEIDKQVSNKDSLSEKDLQTFNKIRTKIIANEKKLGLEGCLKFNSDGTIEITDKCLRKLGERYNQCKKNGINPREGKINSIIEELLTNVMESGECWAIEYDRFGIRTKKLYQINRPGKSYITNIADNISDELNYYNEIKCFKNVKLIPSFKLGYDAKFLSKTKFIDSLDISKINELWNLDITMEESKPFIDKYIETKNIKNLNKIDFNNFIDDELNPEMIKYLFGSDIKISNFKKILPITVFDGLKFFKLKNTRGDDEFKNWILLMLNKGILNSESKEKINNIIKSLVSDSDLSKYVEICMFLNDKGYKKGFPYLEGYSPNKYLEILKYMEKSMVSIEKIPGNMIICELIYKNNLPGEAFEFFGYGDPGDYFIEDIFSMFKEIFENKNGRELYSFLSKYPQKLENLGGKEIKEIELTTKPGGYNFCFRGILEMIKSRKDIRVPTLGNNPTKLQEQKWKESREKIIKEYENILRNYIQGDKDENGNEKPKNETFDKIFFASAVDHKDEDDISIFQGDGKIDDILKNFTKKFEDCSSIIDKNGMLDQSNQKNMIDKIKKYAKNHPNEKILVYLGYHGDKDGCSSNGWEKEDRVKLANISPNIKIMSTRCYFGGAYNINNSKEKNYIYSIKSPVSGASSNSSAQKCYDDAMREGYKKGLGFHELEIYTRLHYDYSFTPLTDFVDYTDFNTGRQKHGKIGIADAGNSRQSEEDVYYG